MVSRYYVKKDKPTFEQKRLYWQVRQEFNIKYLSLFHASSLILNYLKIEIITWDYVWSLTLSILSLPT